MNTTKKPVMPYKPIEMEGSKFIGFNFSNRYFASANMRDCILCYCNFSYSNLKRANLKLADFSYCNLEGTNLLCVKNHKDACFKGATYNNDTSLPRRFSPTKRGMIKVPVKLPKPTLPQSSIPEIPQDWRPQGLVVREPKSPPIHKKIYF